MNTPVIHDVHHESLAEEVARLKWIHQIDLGNGIITPGRWKPNPLVLKCLDTIDFKGAKVLDIGCWDGLWSFEAERRGALEVFATDFISQRSYNRDGTFALAHRALRSQVKYYPHLSIYDVESLGVRDFDVILFCGVYYHLRHPLLALSKLRRVAKEGARLVVEGDVLTGVTDCSARFYYRESYHGDKSNWWAPTSTCLREWVESSFFHVTHEFSLETPRTWLDALKAPVKRLLGRDCCGIARRSLVAEAVRRSDPNYIFPDEDFREFDENAYDA